MEDLGVGLFGNYEVEFKPGHAQSETAELAVSGILLGGRELTRLALKKPLHKNGVANGK